jgi:hypothetical protein
MTGISSINRALLVEATLVDMADSKAEPAAELARMQRLAATYARLPPGATLHTCGVCTEVGHIIDKVVSFDPEYCPTLHARIDLAPSAMPPSSTIK